MARTSVDIILNGRDRASREVRGVQKALTGLSNTARRASIAIAAYFSAQAISSGLRSLARTSDAYQNLTNRIRLVTDGQRELAMVQQRVFQISQQTRSSLESVSTLYFRIALGADKAKFSQERLLNITKTINQAGQIGGGTRETIDAALIQLSQIISAGGAARGIGQELRSLREQTPRVFTAMAEGLGVTGSQMMKLAEEGKITSTQVLEAFENVADTIDSEFSRITPTISSAFTMLSNSIAKLIGQTSQVSGAGSEFAQFVMRIADAVDRLHERVVAMGGAINSLRLIGLGVLEFWAGIGMKVAKFIDRILSGFKVMGEFLGVLVANMIGIFSTGLFNIAQLFRNIFSGEIGGKILSGFFDTWKAYFHNAWMAAKNVALNIRDVFAAAFKAIRTQSLEPFSDVVFRSLTDGFVGVGDALDKIAQGAGDLTKGFRQHTDIPFDPRNVSPVTATQSLLKPWADAIGEAIRQHMILPGALGDEGGLGPGRDGTQSTDGASGKPVAAPQLDEARFLSGGGRASEAMSLRRKANQHLTDLVKNSNENTRAIVDLSRAITSLGVPVLIGAVRK